MILTNLLLVNFVRDYPGAAAWMLAGLLGLIVTLVGGYYWIVSSELKKLSDRDEDMGKRLVDVEKTLEKYEEHVGAGDKMFAALMARVERHMTEEEDQVWGGMRELGVRLGQIHEDNLKAHATIVERLAKVETKIPNGEMAELLGLVRSMAKSPAKRK
jgi:hypothetical protein